ncbi:hypothetical protein [Sandaracinus amylolyticus]|uniref:hypothetical protein n=1 Tax=Sandaracinus amylolyticus TaxID=927083 RepID=UPI0012ECC0B1|nr:hypothetical protein [Sandaracinus amylolyticus]
MTARMPEICEAVARISDGTADEQPPMCAVDRLADGFITVESQEGDLVELFVGMVQPADRVVILGRLDLFVLNAQMDHVVEGVRVETRALAGREVIKITATATDMPARETIDEISRRTERTMFCSRSRAGAVPSCHFAITTSNAVIGEPGRNDFELVDDVSASGELRLRLAGSPPDCACFRAALW